MSGRDEKERHLKLKRGVFIRDIKQTIVKKLGDVSCKGISGPVDIGTFVKAHSALHNNNKKERQGLYCICISVKASSESKMYVSLSVSPLFSSCC